MANKPVTPPPPAAATPTTQTTIGGYAVQVLAFIPDQKDNMRAQGDLLNLLADVNEGKKTVADLLPFMRLTEVKANWTRKRFDPEQAAKLTAKPAVAEPPKQDN